MIESVFILPLMIVMAFTPYFIGVNAIMYGRFRAYLLLGLTGIAGVSMFWSGLDQSIFTLALLLLTGSFLAAAVGLFESVLRGINPFKVLVLLPIIIFGFFGVCSFAFYLNSDVSVLTALEDEFIKVQPEILKLFEKTELDQSRDLFEIKALVMQPKILVKSFLTYGLGTLADFIMLVIWANLFFLLKASRLVKSNNSEYNESILLDIQVPPIGKWFLVISFGLYIACDYFQYTLLTTLSFVILNVVSAFYFFQGFGIYIKFLDMVKISGVLRTFLIILTVFSARLILVVIGFVDEFIDFKKLMAKKN